MSLKQLIDSVAKKLEIDFSEATKQIGHRGAKGTVRETLIVEEFLCKYLPKKIEIMGGEIVSTDGQRSNQTDIVFFDHLNCPVFYDKKDYKIIPIEMVYGVMEVKSKLDSTELEDAFMKINKIKKMPKLAFEPQAGTVVNTSTIYDKEWNYFPTTGFVFAYDSIALPTLRDKLTEIQKSEPNFAKIDIVCILNKGLIINVENTGMITHSANLKTELKAIESENPLLLTTVLIQQLLLSGWMPKFRIQDYFKNIEYGKFL